MNRRSILTKTGKGLMEATGKTSDLARDLRNILKEIDGKVSVSELMRTFSKMTEPELLEALKSMETEGYLREFVGKQEEAPRAPARPPISQSSTDGGEDLDFTAFTPAKPSGRTSEDAKLHAQAQDIARQAQATRAREQAAAKAKAELAARARAEAEHKARLSTRAGLSTQSDALDQARREAEERQRREAEEKARREAVARAVIEAEQAGKREAEERIRKEIQERERRENDEKARREGEVRAKREVEEKVRRDAEERLRREVEERTRQEIEERMRREEVERRRREEAEEIERRKREEHEQGERRARIEAEARTKVEAEMRAKREAEERALRDEEERPRREEELRRRTDEEAHRRREAEESEALERSLREQEEKERREAEQRERYEEQRREEEERGRREAEEEARRAEEEEQRAKEEERLAREEEKAAKKAAKTRKAARAKERAGEEAWRGDEEAVRGPGEASLSAREIWAKRKPGSLARQFAVMLLVILVVAIAALPFVPFEPGPYEKAAQAWLGEPVKIGTVNLTLLPVPQLKFEKVVIGKERPMRAAVIKATPVVTSLLEDRISLRDLALEGATFPREFLAALLQDKGRRGSFGIKRITAKGLKLDIPELNLPALEVDASLSSDGALNSVALYNTERKLSVKVEPKGGRAGIEISASDFPLPVGADLALSEFLAKGTVTRGELALSEVEVRGYGGRLVGNMRLRWSSGWSIEGEFTVHQMEAGKIAAPLLAGGTLDGKGVYSMKGLLPQRLILNGQLEGNFTIQKGSITNVDMTRVLQGSGSGGGTTLFSEMSGNVSADSNRLLVRQIRMAAGLLNAAGQVEMDPQKNLSGRMQVELRAQSVQARATLTLAGTLQNPQFRRSN